MNKTEHAWTGWGYDSTVCRFCHVDLYDMHIQHARTSGGGQYCEDVKEELIAYTEYQENKPKLIAAALDKARSVLSKEEYHLLNLRYFGEYRERDYIKV